MIGTLMDRMLDQRLLVVAGAVALLLGGLYAFQYLNIEAYPDPSPPTIEVIAQNPGWSAEEMERQITVPIEIQLNGMPGLDHIRSISLFGLSDIKCYCLQLGGSKPPPLGGSFSRFCVDWGT